MASNTTQRSGTPTTAATTQAATAISAVRPDDMMYTEKYINDNAWPADFELDINLGNWQLWRCRVGLLATRQGFNRWLNGTLAQPDKTTHPKAHHIWSVNDESLKAFLLSHISQRDYDNTCKLDTAHLVLQELQKTHEKQGLHAKLILMKKATDMRFQTDVLLSKTINNYCALHKCITQMGPIDDDQLLAIYCTS
jgi:hypothetical protein